MPLDPAAPSPPPPPGQSLADALLAQIRDQLGKFSAIQFFILWANTKDPSFLNGQSIQTLMATPSFEAYYAGYCQGKNE